MIATEVICFPLIFIAIFSDIEYSTFLFIVAEIFVLFRQPNLKDWCWNIPLAHWKQKFGYWYPRRNQNNTCYFHHFLFFLFFRYTWQKNGKPYDWQVYDDRISQQPGRGTLVITSPRDEDIGMYFCFEFISYLYIDWV